MLIGPDGQRIGAGQIDRAATLSRINQRIAPQRTTPVDPAQDHCPGIAKQAPAAARAVKPALAKPLDKLRRPQGKRRGAKSQTTAALDTTVQLIGQLAVGAAGGPLIGDKRRKGSAAAGSYRKNHAPDGRAQTRAVRRPEHERQKQKRASPLLGAGTGNGTGVI